jgi:cytochrome c peroxidase
MPAQDGGPGEDPLFTDFTASNIGIPTNPGLAFYAENRPDALGYVANPAGSLYVDGGIGIGSFLTKGHPLSQPSAVDRRWLKLAPDNQARIRVPTLRNVDKRAQTRATSCRAANLVTPAKGRHVGLRRRSTANMNTSKVGRLGLSDAEVDVIVSFMQALTDGFMSRDQQ